MIHYPIIPYHDEDYSVEEVFGKDWHDFKIGDYIFYNKGFYRKNKNLSMPWKQVHGVKNNKLNHKLYEKDTIIYYDEKYIIIEK